MSANTPNMAGTASASAQVPCAPSKEDRGSELCAQWMAVDAARQQASATDRTVDVGIAGVLLGLLTLCVAVYAALQARNAAKAAIRQANDAAGFAIEQRKAGERGNAIRAQENRAKLVVEDSPSLNLPQNGPTGFAFKVANAGNSLAQNVRFEVSLACRHPDGDQVVISKSCIKQLASITPGKTREIGVMFIYDRDAVAAFGNTWFEVVIHIKVKWLDAFGYEVLDEWSCEGSSCIGAMPSPIVPHLVTQTPTRLEQSE